MIPFAMRLKILDKIHTGHLEKGLMSQCGGQASASKLRIWSQTLLLVARAESTMQNQC